MFAVYAVMFYDPAKGDSDGGIPPGTPFENCRRIGHVLFAGRPKMNFRQSK